MHLEKVKEKYSHLETMMETERQKVRLMLREKVREIWKQMEKLKNLDLVMVKY